MNHFEAAGLAALLAFVLICGAGAAGYFYGHHEGALAGQAEVAMLSAAEDSKAAQAATQAAALQKRADASAISSALAAASEANAAAATRQGDLNALRDAQAETARRVEKAENSSLSSSQWSAQPIPQAAKAVLCAQVKICA